MSPDELIHRMDPALAMGRQALDTLLGVLARETVHDGRTDVAALDRYQPQAFRLAHLHARLHAAQAMMEYAGLGELEALLAGAYGGRVLDALRAELPRVAWHLGDTAS